METKHKYTLQLTATFVGGSYADAQKWVVDALTKDEEKTNINIQRIDLVRWTDINTQQPAKIVVTAETKEDDE